MGHYVCVRVCVDLQCPLFINVSFTVELGKKKKVKPCPEIHLSKLLAAKNPQGTC